MAPHRLQQRGPWEPLKGSGDSPVTKSGQDPGFRKTLKSAIWAEETPVLPVRPKRQILQVSLGVTQIAVLLAIPRRGKHCVNSK